MIAAPTNFAVISVQAGQERDTIVLLVVDPRGYGPPGNEGSADDREPAHCGEHSLPIRPCKDSKNMDMTRLIQSVAQGLATIVVLAVGPPLLVAVSPFLFCLGDTRPQRDETTTKRCAFAKGYDGGIKGWEMYRERAERAER